MGSLLGSDNQITPHKDGDKYYVDLLELDDKLDPEKVELVNNNDCITYDKKTGRVTMCKPYSGFDYYYNKEGFASKVKFSDECMLVKIALKTDIKKENSTESDSNKKDNIGTQVVNVADTLMNNKVRNKK